MISTRTDIQINIGSKIGRYEVIVNTNNRVVLGYNSSAVEPWGVWWIDHDGDAYSGSYFTNRKAALQEFIRRSFNET